MGGRGFGRQFASDQPAWSPALNAASVATATGMAGVDGEPERAGGNDVAPA